MERTSRGHRRAGLLCVAGLSAALAVPGLAAAAPAPGDATPAVAATPADTRTATGDGDEPEGPGCEPMVVHRPGAPGEGDERAVAITAQVLAAGDPAWERVSWQAARGVTVALVTVEREHGPETLEGDDLGRGTAEDVLEIAFCGERERGTASGPDTDDTVPGDGPGDDAGRGDQNAAGRGDRDEARHGDADGAGHGDEGAAVGDDPPPGAGPDGDSRPRQEATTPAGWSSTTRDAAPRPRDTAVTLADEPILSLVTTERSAAPSDGEGSGSPAAKAPVVGALLGLLTGGVILGHRRLAETSR